MIPNVGGDEVAISAKLWQYPSGAATVTALRIGAPIGVSVNSLKIAEVAIDSAKLVVADKADIDEFWSETGEGSHRCHICTAPDDSVLRILKKRFGLKVDQVNCVRAEVKGPVSEELEQEIEKILQVVSGIRTVSLHLLPRPDQRQLRPRELHEQKKGL